MLGADMAGTATRLAPIAGGMQHATAQRAAPRRIGEIPIESEQKVVESGIGQAGIGTKLTSSSTQSLTTMDKAGRNDPCPSASGKKYKKCCLPKHETDQRQRFAEQQAERDQRAAAHRLSLRELRAAIAARLAGIAEADDDPLTAASNAVVELIHAGKLDEAEQAARDLPVQFPDVHDGYDRLGMVHEARGEKPAGRRLLPQGHHLHSPAPDDYDDAFVKLVAKLDPPPTT